MLRFKWMDEPAKKKRGNMMKLIRDLALTLARRILLILFSKKKHPDMHCTKLIIIVGKDAMMITTTPRKFHLLLDQLFLQRRNLVMRQMHWL